MASITAVKDDNGNVVRYRVRVVVGHYANGQPKQKMKTFRNRRSGERWGSAQETDRDRGINIDTPQKMLLGAYMDTWMVRAKARGVRPSTLANWTYKIEHYIRPRLGNMLLSKLTTAVLQEWFDALHTPGIGYEATRLLRMILKSALTCKLLLGGNPVAGVKTAGKPDSCGKAWTAQEAKAFSAAAKGDKHQPYWTLAQRFPLRPSEILGLTWSAVNLDEATLEVRGARPTVGGVTFPAGPPKTPAANRLLHLAPDLVTFLRTHLDAQETRKNLLGKLWVDSGLVCVDDQGAPTKYQAVKRDFRRLRDKAMVSHIRLYDLRHTAITLMLALGADEKAVTETAGHKDVAFTRNTYQHVISQQHKDAVNTLTDLLGESEPNMGDGDSPRP